MKFGIGLGLGIGIVALAYWLYISKFSTSEMWCKGEISIQRLNESVEKSFVINGLQRGKKIMVPSPIVSDTAAVYALNIVSVEEYPESKKVVADNRLGALLSFELVYKDGKPTLTNLKGFEGSYSFGPSELVCGD